MRQKTQPSDSSPSSMRMGHCRRYSPTGRNWWISAATAGELRSTCEKAERYRFAAGRHDRVPTFGRLDVET